MRLLVGLPFFRTGRLRWTPFASAEPTPANIRRHYRDHLRRQGKADKFDQRRLDATTALPYVDWWVPEEGFGGFDAYGNAAYVVDADQGDWQNMTKRGRVESGLAEQIPHRGEDWPAKIRRALGIE